VAVIPCQYWVQERRISIAGVVQVGDVILHPLVQHIIGQHVILGPGVCITILPSPRCACDTCVIDLEQPGGIPHGS
jgi:hypothetical protein